MIFRKLFIFF